MLDKYWATSKHQIPSKVKKKTATETFNLLRELYVEDTLSTALVFEWLKKFSEQRGYVGHTELRGVPLTKKTEKKWNKWGVLCEQIVVYAAEYKENGSVT